VRAWRDFLGFDPGHRGVALAFEGLDLGAESLAVAGASIEALARSTPSRSGCREGL
jgi:hypothetical protein